MGAQSNEHAPAEPSGGVSIAAVGPLNDTREPDKDTVVVNTLSFAYPGHKPLISGMSLRLPRGSRCLLIGANGAGIRWSASFSFDCVVCETFTYLLLLKIS